MTPLGALDALFLHLETDATPMHVGALHLLDAAPGTDLHAAIGRHLAARLHTSPVFTRRLRTLPLAIANPVWIDCDVDLDHHLKRVHLPSPGTPRQLAATVARLHGERLDRERPLWQFALIEGLAGGGSALYTKVHHAAIDGAAGVAMAQGLLDASAEAAPEQDALRRIPAADPGAGPLLAEALVRNGRAGAGLLRRAPALARAAIGLLRQEAAALTAGLRGLKLAPASPFNCTIDARRCLATASLPLGAVREIATVQGATVNDVVLALVGGALRRHLQSLGELPEAPLLAAMPVSMRQAGDTQMNTQASFAQASLATDLADPLDRLQAIHRAAGAAKSLSRQLRPAFGLTLPSFGLPWLMSAAAVLYGAGRLAERLPRLANVVVSNVPGPAEPLYLAGARLRSWWPLSIVEHGLGLNVTVLRYVDSLDFGIVAARRALPDAEPLAQALRESFDELERAALPRRGRRAGPPTRPAAAAVRSVRSPAARRPRGGAADRR